jgi:2-oxoglutarate ferredoxin oxidoreductase subunit beta
MVSIDDYKDGETEWCPGCGNFGILDSLIRALVNLGLEPHKVLMVSGIGQAGKLPHYLKCNTFNGLHGRGLPVATGAKLANPELTVIAVGGDGDSYGEGGNHFIHAVRRNPDITLLAHDNQIYGLTKGQASPTSEPGMITKLQTHGVITTPFNPLAVAISLDCPFVARGFAGDTGHLSSLIAEAVSHPGFALVDILQPCVSFNKLNTFRWYKERVYRLEEEGHDPANRAEAFGKALEWGERIPTGVIYRRDSEPFESRQPVLKKGPLAGQEYDPQALDGVLESFL